MRIEERNHLHSIKKYKVEKQSWCKSCSKLSKGSLLLFSRSVTFDSVRSHGLQHTRLPCPSLSPRVCSNSCPLSWWCHPTISSKDLNEIINEDGYSKQLTCLVAQMVKNLPANAGVLGLIPVSERSPGEGNGNPLQYSCLESPLTEEPGGWWSMGSQKESDTT